MATHPSDRFDDVQADLHRVGAHRVPRSRRRALLIFGWAALATGVLVLSGVVAINVIGNGNAFTGTLAPAPAATEADEVPTTPPTAEPVVDGSVLVTVLNGTDVRGLAVDVAETLTDSGWTVGSRADASARDIETTTVYYWAPENEGAARGLASTLGSAEVVLSETFAPAEGEDPAIVAELTIVLGSDFVP